MPLMDMVERLYYILEQNTEKALDEAIKLIIEIMLAQVNEKTN